MDLYHLVRLLTLEEALYIQLFEQSTLCDCAMIGWMYGVDFEIY